LVTVIFILILGLFNTIGSLNFLMWEKFRYFRLVLVMQIPVFATTVIPLIAFTEAASISTLGIIAKALYMAFTLTHIYAALSNFIDFISICRKRSNVGKMAERRNVQKKPNSVYRGNKNPDGSILPNET
jgi:hypothetical protein